jgi:hypothetical protein
MEKNLPFIEFGITDKNYNNRVLPFLGNVDNGDLFKWYVGNIWRLLSYALLVGGIAITIAELFGDSGFIKQNLQNEALSGGKKAGAGVGLVIGFVVSIVAAWFMYSVTKKRTDQLKDQEYNGLLNYIFCTVMPRQITLIGELSFIMVLYIGIMQLVATLVGSAAYAPLLSIGEVLMSAPGIDTMREMLPNAIVGDYDNFDVNIKMALTGIITSVLVLIAYYIYREIYNYAIRIVTALIHFIPKFAIPLAIRNRSEN